MLDSIVGILEVAIPFLVVLTLLVFVHELGHYWVARRNGVKVEVFSVGFGPELFGWTSKAGTRWRVSALPLGGYVKMLGDMDATSRPDDESLRGLTDAQRQEAFPAKSLRAKAAIVAAGPLANFAFAWFLLAMLFIFVGRSVTPALVTEVMPDSAAAAAGLQAGDLVTEANGRSIDRFEELQRVVQLNLDQPLSLVIERDGQERTLTAHPTVLIEEDSNGCEIQLTRLGVRGTLRETEHLGPFEGLWAAATETWSLARDTLIGVGQIIVGTRTTDELGGPIRIAEMSGQVAQIGFVSLILFTALLSVNLGLINLFPIPMLDGGHLLFYAYEAVRGRPLGPRAQDVGFKLGLGLVLSLMVFATINDLLRINACG
ncbi:MAG: RIP metalloprotease RseP [Rhodospirillales bacterium]